MAKNRMRKNSLLSLLALVTLGGSIAWNSLAASDTAIGGIGGTGIPTMRGGIGGTGAPAMNGGIGGTGLRPDAESDTNALAGKVLFIVGKVEAQNLGKIRSLTKGDFVRVGDTLKSGSGATMQVRMEDGGTIVLRPESQLTIESFVYNKAHDANEHMALALLSGGFRAVTGEIGHLHKENYLIRTLNAQIGILGTDHETVFIPASESGLAGVVAPGTYNHVISGGTVLQDAQGKLMIKPNQTGFAALNGANPVMIGRPLPIFGDMQITSGIKRHADTSSGGISTSTGIPSADNNSGGSDSKATSTPGGAISAPPLASDNPFQSEGSPNSAGLTSKQGSNSINSPTFQKNPLPTLPSNSLPGSIPSDGGFPSGSIIRGR